MTAQKMRCEDCRTLTPHAVETAFEPVEEEILTCLKCGLETRYRLSDTDTVDGRTPRNRNLFCGCSEAETEHTFTGKAYVCRECGSSKTPKEHRDI